MDKLIHGPSGIHSDHTSKPANTSVADLDFHPFDSSNILTDFKVLLTRPRYFFEFFTHRNRINHLVWAKVILIYLALAALNSMVSFSHSIPGNWSANIEGLDPRMQSTLINAFSVIYSTFSQVFLAAVPFFALIITALNAAGSLLALRLLGGKAETMSFSGLFCVLIAAQWTTIFGFVPTIGTTLVALVPFVYSIIGMAQVSRLSKLRTFMAAFVLPIFFTTIALGLIAFAMVAMVSALFT